MFVKFYSMLDLSKADLDGVLTAGPRAKALRVARERHLPVRSLTRAVNRMHFYFYVFQCGADTTMGTVTLVGIEPGTQVTVPVRQLDHYQTPAMPLREMDALLAAVEEDYPPTALTAVMAAALTKVLDLWADAHRRQQTTVDVRELDRVLCSEFLDAVRTWRDALIRVPRLSEEDWDHRGKPENRGGA